MNKKEYQKFRKTVSNPLLLDNLREPYLDAIYTLRVRTPPYRLFAVANIGRGIERVDRTSPFSFSDGEEYERVVKAIKNELYGLLHSIVKEMR